MTRLLFLVSSARVFPLADGTLYPTGYFAEEALKPYDRFVAAGVDLTVATPDGQPPEPDPYGLEPMFHYPDEDEDFLLSVIRSFMKDVDDIRVTLQHLTELDMIAARRVYEAIKAKGVGAFEARKTIERAARASWSQNKNFVELLAADEAMPHTLSVSELRTCADAVQADASVAAQETADRLAAIPGFLRPVGLAQLSDAQILEFDGVFIPGGHGPMVDMASDPGVGRVLKLLQRQRKVIAALCHGPAALLSAGDRPDGLWLFDGYKLTAFNDEEEDQTRVGQKGLPWYLEAALKNAGAVFDDAPSPWCSHIVVDRNLVTGQNPMSADALADAVLKRLQLQQVRAA